jgi:hypothetical protein
MALTAERKHARMLESAPRPFDSEIANRTQLVSRFNELVGPPHPAVRSMQLRFISSNLTKQEEYAFRELYERAIYEIETARHT